MTGVEWWRGFVKTLLLALWMFAANVQQWWQNNRWEFYMACVTKSLIDRVIIYTDAGTWKASWHWKRTSDGSITLEGAKQMLVDLGCDKCEGEEILIAVRHIHERYKLANELREIIRLSNSGQME